MSIASLGLYLYYYYIINDLKQFYQVIDGYPEQIAYPFDAIKVKVLQTVCYIQYVI